MLPPAFIVWRPATRVTLSKNWRSFWFVMSGWLPFDPRLRAPLPPPVVVVKMILLIAEVASFRLMLGIPTADAGFCRYSIGVMKNLIELHPNLNSFSQLPLNV